MKQFWRTAAGKCLLFLLTLGSIAVFLVSAVGVVAMAELGFYFQTSEQVTASLMEQQIMNRNEPYLILTRTLQGSDVRSDEDGSWHFKSYSSKHYVEDNRSGSLCFAVVNAWNRELGCSTQRPDSESRWYYEYTLQAALDPESGQVWDLWYVDDGPMPSYGIDPQIFTVRVSVKENLPNRDGYWLVWKASSLAWQLRYWVFLALGLSLILGIVCFVALMNVSARRAGTEELRPGPLHRVPYDLMLAVAAVVVILPPLWLDEAFRGASLILWVSLGVLLVIDVAVLLGLSMGAAGRIKDRSLIRDSLIVRTARGLIRVLRWVLGWLRRLGRWILKLLRGVPLMGKTLAVLGGLSLVELMFLLWRGSTSLLLLWCVEKMLLLPAILWFGICLHRLQEAGRAMAGGNMNHKVDTRGMYWELKAHGEDLNAIAQGMTIAVEDRLRSERMKTELITNVSHDLKTPLTSIVNYARLIGDEPCENEKITEYAGVLVRQSERLRRLIDDLVEASKASTGNLEVHPVPCDAAMFLSQAGGEFEEKLNAAGLTLVTRCPEESIRILADSRRMWRIFDNLMNNICKYGQSGTRVYLTLEKLAGHAVISFKNTSRDPLDLSEEELMERFVRGDSSRNTEGNGLGLSIARSLAELQGGSLRVTTDGDLFKAILTFPVMAEPSTDFFGKIVPLGTA